MMSRQCTILMFGVALVLLSKSTTASPRYMACSRKIEMNGKVMCTTFQPSSVASIQLTKDSSVIACGQDLMTGVNYGFDIKGIVISDMQFLIEATSTDLMPFPGAAFSEPLIYNGKTLMNESNRNSFPEFSKYKNFSLDTTETCISRTAGGPSDIRPINSVQTQVGVNKNVSGTLSFSKPGTVRIRIVWSTKPPAGQGCTGVWVNEACSYTVKQDGVSAAPSLIPSAGIISIISCTIAVYYALMLSAIYSEF
jgi:hypothetical protein